MPKCFFASLISFILKLFGLKPQKNASITLQPGNSQPESSETITQQPVAPIQPGTISQDDIINNFIKLGSPEQQIPQECKLYKCSNEFIKLANETNKKNYTFYICETIKYLYCWKNESGIVSPFILPHFYIKCNQTSTYNRYDKNPNIKIFNTTNCFVFKTNDEFKFYLPEDQGNTEISEHQTQLNKYINNIINVKNPKIEYVTKENEIMFILNKTTPLTYIFCKTDINHKSSSVIELIINLTYINQHLLQNKTINFYESETPHIVFNLGKKDTYFFKPSDNEQYSSLVCNSNTEYMDNLNNENNIEELQKIINSTNINIPEIENFPILKDDYSILTKVALPSGNNNKIIPQKLYNDE